MDRQQRMAANAWIPFAALLAALLIGLAICGLARAAVDATCEWEPHYCDGSTTEFTFSFGVFATSEVYVYLETEATNVATLLTENSEYTVSLPNDDGWLTPGGTVTTTSTYSTAYTLWICRRPPLTQVSDYDTADELDLAALEDDFDRTVLRDQYLQRQLYRINSVSVALQGVQCFLASQIPHFQRGVR